MTDTTPTSSNAHEVESLTEQQMRSDFMHAQHFVSRDPEDYDPADSVDHAEYAGPWLDRGDEWTDHWFYLSDATDRWTSDPEAAAKLAQAREDAHHTTPIERRSEDQARYIATHGIERDESGLLTSHYVTRLHDRPGMDAGGAAPWSPLAAHQRRYLSGTALANTERDGMER